MRVRQASGGQGAGFCSPVSCLPLAGPPVQELDPHPHPGGSQTGRARLPRALSQESLGAEWERTTVRGSIDLASPLAASLPPHHWKTKDTGSGSLLPLSVVPPCLLPHQGQAFRNQLGAPPHAVLSPVTHCGPNGGQEPQGCPPSESGLLSPVSSQ